MDKLNYVILDAKIAQVESAVPALKDSTSILMRQNAKSVVKTVRVAAAAIEIHVIAA